MAQEKDLSPEKKLKAENAPVRIEYLGKDQKPSVGKRVIIKLKILDRVTKQPIDDLKDVRVLTFLAPGIWQEQRREIRREGHL